MTVNNILLVVYENNNILIGNNKSIQNEPTVN